MATSASDDGFANTPDRGLAPYVVDAVITILSVVGSLCMILPFVFVPSMRRLRHRLILGLAIADLFTAVSVLGPTLYVLANNTLQSGSAGCQASGFLYTASVISASLWTVILALVTYMTLAHPLARFTGLVDRTWCLPTLAVIALAPGLILAIVAQATQGFINVGGFCYLQNLLFGQLALFVPRAATFIVVIVLYVRLWILLRSSRRRMQGQFSDDPTLDLSFQGRPPSFVDSRRASHATADSERKGSDTTLVDSTALDPTKLEMSEITSRPAVEIKLAPRRLDRPAALSLEQPTFSPVAWTGTTEGLKVQRPLSPRTVDDHSRFDPASSRGSAEDALRRVRSVPSGPDDSTDTLSPHAVRDPSRTLRLSRSISGARERPRSVVEGGDDPTRASPRSLRLFKTLSRSQPAPPLLLGPPRLSLPIPSAAEMLAAGDRDRRAARRSGAADGELDFASVLAEGGPCSPEDAAARRTRRWSLATRRPMSDDELRRRATMLMLLYPAAYLTLFSVSIVRLIYEFTSDSPVPKGLAYTSRWLILSSGLVDALVYVGSEQALRSSVRWSR